MVAPWSVVSREVALQLRIFDVCRDTLVSPVDGRTHVVAALDVPDWVNVLAETDDGRWVMVRQWRVGTRTTTLEIPGGMVDPGEAPLAAAQRELREETGYAADTWQALGAIEPNPAFQNNRCHTFLARGARPVGAQAPDEHEDLEVVLVAKADVDGLILDGAITHVLVAHAFHLLDLHARRGG